jgi:hypothetical protein
MYCPKCRTEYRKGFYTCADCEIPLVTELPPELSASQEPEDDQDAYLHSVEKDDLHDSVSDLDPGDAVLLITINDNSEALAIIELLDEYGIKAYLESGENSPIAGMYEQISLYRIFVNKLLLNEARKIIDSQNEGSNRDRRDFEQRFEKKETFWNRGSGLIVAGFLYALTFLPTKELDEPIKYVFYGASLCIILFYIFSYYRGKESKRK